MPSAHAELIERSYRAYRSNDLEALLALYHPEAVWDMTQWENFPDAPVFRGLSGTEELLRMLHDVFGEFDVAPMEIIDAGANRAFVKARMAVRGRESGVALHVPPFAQIIEFRDGLIVRVDTYTDVEASRRAAGLPSTD